jgi:hypothetical protein
MAKGRLLRLPVHYFYLNRFPHNALGEVTTFDKALILYPADRSLESSDDYQAFTAIFQPGDVLHRFWDRGGVIFQLDTPESVPYGLCILRRHKVIACIKLGSASNRE